MRRACIGSMSREREVQKCKSLDVPWSRWVAHVVGENVGLMVVSKWTGRVESRYPPTEEGLALYIRQIRPGCVRGDRCTIHSPSPIALPDSLQKRSSRA